MEVTEHIYEVRPRADRRGSDLISEHLPFGSLWYTKADHAVSYARFYSRSHGTKICIFNSLGEVISDNEYAGEFRDF